jgi:hypothetical protein
VLWLHDVDNYKLGSATQRLKAAVSDRSWRATRYVLAAWVVEPWAALSANTVVIRVS